MKAARRGPNRRRWCSRHNQHYLTWTDAQQTVLARCPECEDEDKRAEAAAQRRTEAAQAKAAGEA